MRYIILLIIVFPIVFYGTTGDVWVHSEDDLRHISCGWPLEFGFSDQSWRDPPTYPWKLSCLSTWGDGEVQWSNFWINVGIFYLAFLIVLSIPINISPKQTLLENLTKQTLLGRICFYANKKRKIILITLALLFLSFVLYMVIVLRYTTPIIHTELNDSIDVLYLEHIPTES